MYVFCNYMEFRPIRKKLLHGPIIYTFGTTGEWLNRFLQNAYWDVLLKRIYTQPILFKVVPIKNILREDRAFLRAFRA